jgi:hypothetical protein
LKREPWNFVFTFSRSNGIGSRYAPEEGATQDVQLSACLEVANANQGFTRFLYEMWKFFLDGTYAHGTHNDFISWLEQHDADEKLNHKMQLQEQNSTSATPIDVDAMATAPDGGPPTPLLPIALSSGPIIGGRFLQTNRVAMLLVPLWDVMLNYLESEYVPAFDGESKTNKLAQDVLIFLKQEWRLPMVRAAAMGYGDILGPFLFQLRKDQTVLLVADWWVKLDQELTVLV